MNKIYVSRPTINTYNLSCKPAENLKKKIRVLFLSVFVFLASVFNIHSQNINIANGSTSTCSGNFYDSGGNGGSYSSSESFQYTICSNNGQSPHVNFSSFSTESGFDFLTIYDGSTSGAPIIGVYSGTTSPGNISASGSCLTFVFTSDGSVTSSGWAATISCGAAGTSPIPLQGPCTNLGFESGTTGWYGTTGKVTDGTATAAIPNYVPTALNTFGTQTSVMTGGTDPFGGFNCVFAGAQSIRLGDGSGSGSLAASIEQYFQVTAANANFTYNYACVLEDGGHPNYQQPFFKVDVFDQNGNAIACGNYLITAPGSGWTLSGVASAGVYDVYYKPWTTVSVNLLSYIGQNVRVKFTSGDCTQGGHFGYAYIDCSCAPYTIASQTICVGSSVTLSAPTGALSYSWTPGGSTASSITVSPASTTVYTCNVTSQGTTPCSGLLTTTITVLPTPTTSVNSATICKGNSTVLTANGATTYSWTPSTGLSATTGSTVTANPTVTTVYTVTGTNATCTSVATSTVTVSPIPTVTVNPPTICNGSSTVLTASGATTYSWSPATGLSATTGANPTANPTVTTTYTVVGTTATCTSTATNTVTVNPMPTVTVNSPTICRGSSTVMTASGATSYSWSPSTGLSATTGANPTANPTVTTTYTVVGTTATCTAQATSIVTVNPLPTVTVASATICPGASTTMSASGATTYSWAPSGSLSSSTGSTVTANPGSTTVYTITGTSASCTAATTATVTIGGAITPSVPSATICAGSSTTLNATGGTTYTWSPATGLSGTSGASVTANPSSTTTYTINAASGACTGSTTAVVTVNPLPTVTVNSPSICVNGSTTLNASGAATYSWSPATGLSATTGASVTANPTVTTTYTVVGTTATCTAQATSIVTVNPLPTITVNAPSICPGATGTLTAAGASTYTWSTGANGATITASPASTTNYTVSGSTAAGCVSSATTSITVLSGLTLTPPSSTICVGDSSTLTVSGASTYTWSPATGLSSNTGSSVNASPASSTTYTITGSSGTCSAVATATVIVNPLPIVTVNSATICVGQQTATLTAAGAATYTWNPATGLSSANGSPVTANPTSTTSYTVTGTDVNGCVNTATTTIIANPQPTLTINNGFICNGSSATLNVSGASTYTWSPATGLSASTGASVNASPAVTTQYTITGTDANGCTNTDTTSVTVVSNPTITPSNATICIGSSVVLTASGAATYVWNPGTGLSSTSGSTVTASPAATTIYTITGTAGTCTAVATATVNVNPLPVVTVNSETICIGQQTATLTAAGAVTYSWDPSTGLSSTTGTSVTGTPTTTTAYTVTGTDLNGCVNTATTAITVNPLPTITLNSGFVCNGSTATLNAGGASTYSWSPGTGLSATTGSSVNANPSVTTQYTITGTDANGCFNSDTTRVTVVSNPTVTPNSVTICIGDSAMLTATGAATYVWTPGAGLSSTTGSSIMTSPSASTVYTVTGTAGTCTAVATATVTVNSLPTVSVNSGTICLGQQTATLSATGASTYSWIPSTGLSSSSGTNVTATPAATTSYTVTGTDVNGCVNTATTSVTVNTLPVVTLSGALICVGGTTTLNAAGAVTYSWIPGTGLSGTTGASVNANPATTTQYTVVGVDANGCISGDTATVLVVTNPVISVASSTICIGNTINLTANGANTYTWSPAAGLSSTSGSVVTASPTVTSVYTIDGTVGTCTATTTATVVVNPLPVITIGSNSPVCVNQTLNLNSTGGPGYSWNGPNSFSSTLQNPSIAGVTSAANGTYTLTVMDINTCVNTATISVIVNPLPVVTVAGSTVCLNQTISLSANGGVGYSWSGPLGFASNLQNPSIPNANAAMAGTYVVTVTDANNCVNANIAQVVLNSLPVVSVTSGTVCKGSITPLVASGANTYAWSPITGLNSASSATVNAGPNATTTYTIIGTDSNGCVDTTTTIVNVNPVPAIALTPSAASGCAPMCVSFSNTAGTSGTCSWTFGDGTTSTSCEANHCFIVAGNYSSVYSLTDANGCTNKDTAVITVYPVPDADFSFDPQPTTVLDPYIHFHNETTGGAVLSSFSWTFGDNSGITSALSSPTHTYLEAGSYPVQLVVVSNHGCRDSITKTVVIGEDYFIYVPNAFSPNGDGVNDYFFAKGEGIKDFKMYIFDRWGNMVFFSDDIYKGWDGRYQSKGTEIVQEDVFVWKIELHTFKNEPKMLKGTVSLIK